MTQPERPGRWSDIPVETLRDFYRDRVELSSLRRVAYVCGVGHSTLHNLLSGANPQPRVRRILAEYYMAAKGLKPDPTRDPNATAALDVLAGYFPPRERRAFKQSFAESMARQFDEKNEPLPPWLAAMLGRE